MSKLTEQEIKVINSLAETWNEFSKLDQFYHGDIKEFERGINMLQDLIMKRLAIRSYPDLFVQK